VFLYLGSNLPRVSPVGSTKYDSRVNADYDTSRLFSCESRIYGIKGPSPQKDYDWEVRRGSKSVFKQVTESIKSLPLR